MKRCFWVICVLCLLLSPLGGSHGIVSAVASPGMDPAELPGVWQDSDIVGSGYTRLFLFYPDGRYLFLESQMDETARDREHSGYWRLEENSLILTVMRRVTLVGDEATQEGMETFEVTDEWLVGTEAELQRVEPAEELRFALEDANMAPDTDGYCSMRLESVQFYQLTDEEGLLYFEDWFSFTPYTFWMDPSFLERTGGGQRLLSHMIFPEKYVGLDWSGRAVMLPDDGALLQDTLWGNPYVLRMNAEGDVLWEFSLEQFFEDEQLASGLLSDAVLMPDGRIALLFQYYGEEEAEQPDCAIVFVTEEGRPDSLLSMPLGMKSLVGDETGLYAVGEDSILEDEGYSAAICVIRLALDGAVEWERQFKLDGFNTVEIQKALWADDGLILTVMGQVISTDGRTPLLYKMDGPERLRLIWRGESTTRTVISDVAATPEGGFLALLNEFVYSGERELIGRKGSVVCWDGLGRLLWTVPAARDGTLDSVIRIPEGYLCASRGMDQENCPNLGEGWFMLVSPDGGDLLGGGILDLSSEGVEVWGLTTDAQGEAILYGCSLLEPGFPGHPFIAKVDLSEALRAPAEEGH